MSHDQAATHLWCDRLRGAPSDLARVRVLAEALAAERAAGAREMHERVIETMVNLEAAALVRNGTGYGELRAMCIESVRKRIEALPLEPVKP